jgi:arylsulfatase A-like enzyme
VPLILNWPARIRNASTCTQPVAGWDLFPTLAQAAGVPSIPAHDGQDLLGAGHAESERELYFEHATGGWQALRMGDWKALRRNAIRDPAAPVELYNLADESRDRAAEQPELVQRALARFASRTGALLPQWDFPAPAR